MIVPEVYLSVPEVTSINLNLSLTTLSECTSVAGLHIYWWSSLRRCITIDIDHFVFVFVFVLVFVFTFIGRAACGVVLA